VQVIGGTIDTEGMPVTKAFIARYSPAFPVGESEYNTMMRFAGYSPMVRTFVPFLFFIDRKGVIRAQYMGSDPFFREETPNIRKMLDSLVKEPGGPAAAPPAKPPAAAKPAAPAPAKKAG
jgi:hypothetical protein